MNTARLPLVGSSSVSSLSSPSHLVAIIARLIVYALLSSSLALTTTTAFPSLFVRGGAGAGGIDICDFSPSPFKHSALSSKNKNKNNNIGLKMASVDDDETTTTSWIPGNVEQEKEARSKLDIWPLDEYNAQLLNSVHPRGYENVPKTTIKPHDVYDLIAIGSGAGGLVSSRQSARRGAKSAMISETLAGGDCLNTGCVPSKAIIRSARAVSEVKRAAEFGIVFKEGNGDFTVDFAAVMKRVRMMRAKIAPVDGHKVSEEAGTHVYQGRGRLTSPTTVEVNGITLQFKKCVLATGGRPAIPSNIEGLVKGETPYTTSETLFNLEELPPRMVVLGGGVVALEMAQTFSLLGSNVSVINRSSRLFASKHGDAEAATILQSSLEHDGVTFYHNTKISKVTTLRQGSEGSSNKKRKRDDGTEEDDESSTSYFPLMKLTLDNGGELECECFLIAAGRLANVEDLGLEEGNVEYEIGKGIKINDLVESVSNPNVYAIGDCAAGVPRLTHMSGEMAKMAVQNGLADDNWKLSSLLVPAVMYTEPEYATVGIASEEEAKSKGIEVDVYRTSLEHNDRAILESDNVGFTKIIVKKDTDEIIGATIVASRAGEIINEVSLAIKNNIGLYQIGRNIHSYPTTGESVMMCGIQYINTKVLKRLD